MLEYAFEYVPNVSGRAHRSAFSKAKLTVSCRVLEENPFTPPDDAAPRQVPLGKAAQKLEEYLCADHHGGDLSAMGNGRGARRFGG